jgi:hypothetical protein
LADFEGFDGYARWERRCALVIGVCALGVRASTDRDSGVLVGGFIDTDVKYGGVLSYGHSACTIDIDSPQEILLEK